MSDNRLRRIETERGTSMRQQALADEGFEKPRKKTRREQFLEEMEQIIPWTELAAVIEPVYPQQVPRPCQRGASVASQYRDEAVL